MKKQVLIIGAVILLGLVGCGQKDIESEVVTKSNGSDVKRAYLKREDLQPFEKYIPLVEVRNYQINSPEHQKMMDGYRNLYWSATPANYELLAYDFLDGYADELDTFKKKDMLSINKAKLDAVYDNFPKNKYFAIKRNKYGTFQKYSEKDKGFPYTLGFVKEGINDYESLVKIAEKETSRSREVEQFYWTLSIAGQINTEIDIYNKERDQWDHDKRVVFVYVPKNDEEARLIEAELSSPNAKDNIDQVFLGRAVASRFYKENKAYAPIFMIDGVALVNNKTNKVLFTISKKELGDRYEINCGFHLEALGIKDAEAINGDYCSY